LGTTLKHSYQPNGKGAATTESLSQPDDIVTLGGNLYAGFQNGVGSQGEASTSGNLDSTLVEFTPSGSVVKQWDVTGKIDGMGADAATGQVFATVNEDSKSKALASAPAVFAVTLNAGAKTATVAPFFADNATATGVNGSSNGKKVTLALTDPDSNGVVPSTSPQFGGDFVTPSRARSPRGPHTPR
jgi:hypothetical protein